MNRYKNLAFKVAGATPIGRITRSLKKGAVALCYHGIVQEIIDPRVQSIHLPFGQFEKQIQYIRRNFRVISIDDVKDCLGSGRRIDGSQVLLTFDDGYKNILEWVAPFLKSYDLPFAVFVSTKHVETKLRFPTYWLRASLFHTEKTEIHVPALARTFALGTIARREAAELELRRVIKVSPASEVSRLVDNLKNLLSEERWREINERFTSDAPMDWDDLREIVRLGGVVGSHGHDHFIFHTRQNPPEMERQMAISRSLIEKNIGRCRYLAYPEGNPRQISPEVQGILLKTGYHLAFCSQEGEIIKGANAFFLPRLGAPFDFDHFAFRLNNSYLYGRRYRKSIQDLAAGQDSSL